MIKTLASLAVASLVAVAITGCGEQPQVAKKETKKEEVAISGCKIEHTKAPMWACIPEVEGFYAGVGIAKKSKAGLAHMRKVALMNGRSDLTQQIQSQVKDSMEGFTKATGMGDESVDHVTTAVTSQLASISLKGSKAVDYWEAPSGDIYMLVTVPKSSVNQKVKDTVKSSFNKDDARWQQFQSEKAQAKLEKAFPTN